MTTDEHIALAGRPVLLYDGVCGLCNHTVQALLRLDRGDHLRFVPQQSALGRELLGPFPAIPEESEGVVLITEALTARAAVFRQADAMIEALRYVGGVWSLFGGLLRFVPRFMRRWGYGNIARNRYRVFGKFDACPVPTKAQRSRILGM